jgi:hypothetical protein
MVVHGPAPIEVIEMTSGELIARRVDKMYERVSEKELAEMFERIARSLGLSRRRLIQQAVGLAMNRWVRRRLSARKAKHAKLSGDEAEAITT